MSTQVDRCHLIASVLASDGMVTGDERAFLDALMNKYGLSDEDKQRVRDFEGAEGALDRLKSLPDAERSALVDEILQASLVDMKLTPLEREHVQKLTDALR